MNRIEMERAVAFADAPATEGGLPWLPLYRPPPNGSVRGYIVSDKLTGVLQHYFNERSQPHMRDASQCEGCRLKQRPRFVGYLAIYEAGPGRLALAQISEAAVKSNLFLKDPKHHLRGGVLTVQRLGKAINARCAATVQYPKCKVELPPEPDVVGALFRLWGVRQIVQVDIATGGMQ